MKVHVLLYYFQGDDIEFEVKGVFSNQDDGINKMIELVDIENSEKLTEYDTPIEAIEFDPFHFEGYVQHFGPTIYKLVDIKLE